MGINKKPEVRSQKSEISTQQSAVSSQKPNAENGFLLMEVLLAVTILAVALTVLLQSIIQSIDAGRLTREYSQAMYLANEKMWELKQNYAFRRDHPVEIDERPFKGGLSDYDYIAEITEDSERLVYRIKVTVRWDHKGREKKFILESMVPYPRTKEDFE